MITEDYVSFEVAKLLKERGFYEPTCGFYHDDYIGTLIVSSPSNHNGSINSIAAPSQGHAMKWLREKYNIIICIEPHSYNTFDNKTSSYIFTYWTDDNYNEPYCWRNETNSVFGKSWSTYEEACEEAIKYCLENLI